MFEELESYTTQGTKLLFWVMLTAIANAGVLLPHNIKK